MFALRKFSSRGCVHAYFGKLLMTDKVAVEQIMFEGKNHSAKYLGFTLNDEIFKLDIHLDL